MERSIATALGRPPQPESDQIRFAERLEATLERFAPTHVGLAFVALALVVYVLSNPARNGVYNHFVWQAQAFLEGRFAIEYLGFQDVMPLADMPGFGLLPFPPLPAIVLLPFVALFGMATDAQLVGAVIGAINVGLAWRLVTRLTERRGAAVLATVFFAFGTVHWYAAMLASTWFLAHVVAIAFVLLGMTMAIDAERREALHGTQNEPRLSLAQVASGFVFAIGGLARLPVLFGGIFFAFVGGGGSLWRRGFYAGLGVIVPVAVLVGYNLLVSGHVFNPAYEYLYQHEYLGYMPPELAINTAYGIEDIRHVPVNLLIMFAWPPDILPKGTDCGLGLLNPSCPLAQPNWIGMSILLTSPAYLLAVPLVIREWRDRLVRGAALAVVLIALVNLMHFSQGWVQFGYRFSNDFVPFALVLVTLAIARYGVGRLTLGLVGLSVLINAWGVYWGVVLGW